MGDWTAEAEPAVTLCQDWVRMIKGCLKVELYLFGNVIYKGGEQFDRTLSDIDIVAVLPIESDTTGRVVIIDELRTKKVRLELDTIPVLGRPNAGVTRVSLVPITSLELRANIHKSGARSFFDRHFFLDLSSGSERLGLPKAGVATLPDESRHLARFFRARNAIELMFGRLKDFRRIATRYDKLAIDFLAAVDLTAAVCY